MDRLEIFSKLFENHQYEFSMEIRDIANKWELLSIDEKMNVTKEVGVSTLMLADGQLDMIAAYVKPCKDHMSQQLCGSSMANGGGNSVGNTDDTWSYASVLRAWFYRGLVTEMMQGVENRWTLKRSKMGNMYDYYDAIVCGGCEGQCKE